MGPQKHSPFVHKLLRSCVSTPCKGQVVGNSFCTKSVSGRLPQPQEKCPASRSENERRPGAAQKAAVGNDAAGRHEEGSARLGSLPATVRQPACPARPPRSNSPLGSLPRDLRARDAGAT